MTYETEGELMIRAGKGDESARQELARRRRANAAKYLASKRG